MKLIDLLRSPSAYEHDRWGFARNQLGHGYIVGGFGALFVGWWILPVYAAWEAVQMDQYRSKPWDSVDDFANVMTIALAAITNQPLFLAAHAAYLISGWLRR